MNPFKKPQELWKTSKDGIELAYPIFQHDLTIPDDPIIKLTIEEVCGDVDFWGREWDDNTKIIDSLGRVFIPGHEKSGIHESGVFPEKVERTIELEEVKSIMILAINNTTFRIKEDKDILIQNVKNSSDIQIILMLCGKYF